VTTSICEVPGRLGEDAIFKILSKNNTALLSFSIAERETWYKDGETKEKVIWHRVKLWGKIANSFKDKLLKGQEVKVMGKLRYDLWEKEGVKRKDAYIEGISIMV